MLRELTTETVVIVTARKEGRAPETRPMTWGALEQVLARVGGDHVAESAGLILATDRSFAFDGPGGVLVTGRLP